MQENAQLKEKGKGKGKREEQPREKGRTKESGGQVPKEKVNQNWANGKARGLKEDVISVEDHITRMSAQCGMKERDMDHGGKDK